MPSCNRISTQRVGARCLIIYFLDATYGIPVYFSFRNRTLILFIIQVLMLSRTVLINQWKFSFFFSIFVIHQLMLTFYDIFSHQSFKRQDYYAVRLVYRMLGGKKVRLDISTSKKL